MGTLQDILAKYGSLENYLKALTPVEAANERRRLGDEMQQRYFTPKTQVRRVGLPEKKTGDGRTNPSKPLQVDPAMATRNIPKIVDPAPIDPARVHYDKYKAGFRGLDPSDPRSEQLAIHMKQRGVDFDRQARFQQEDKFAAILQSLKQKETNGQKETRQNPNKTN